MPPEQEKAKTKRDALLSELDTYHEQLLNAARARDEETLNAL